MNSAFKVLVAVACVAVIAFVGVFFFERWQAAEASRKAAAAAEIARAQRNVLALTCPKVLEDNKMMRWGRKLPDPEGTKAAAARCEAAGFRPQ